MSAPFFVLKESGMTYPLLGKYKGILVSIALFLLLDASVLILNFYMSFQIADDAVGVNLAGRQRMLSQRMVKSLLELDREWTPTPMPNQADIEPARAELAATVDLFDRTLTAFAGGGQALGASGEPVTLKAVDSTEAERVVQEALILWAPYRDRIRDVLAALDRGRFSAAPPALGRAIDYAQTTNLPLLALMNDLTVDLERVASSKATRLRLIQTVGISLALLNFLIILFHFLRQLRDSDRKIEAARQETTEILETVREGLFLLDADLAIGHQHSRHLSAILGRDDLAGQGFDALLTGMIGDAERDTAVKFVRLLFDGRIKEKLVGDLNPLQQVEVFVEDGTGRQVAKHLSFHFTRVTVEGRLRHLLVTVRDVTEEIRLARELEASQTRADEQLDRLTGILHVNPDLLNPFIDNAFEAYARINRVLEQPAKNRRTLQAKIETLFVEVHRFKGEAAALNLAAFEQEAQAFEQEIAALRDRSGLVGNDFLRLTVRLDRLIDYTQAIRLLAAKLAAFGRAAGGELPAEPASNWRHLHDLAKTVAERQGKAVMLVTSGLSECRLPEATRRLVNDVCIQFIRNAVAHGIEAPEDRVAGQKPAHGRIDVRLVTLATGELELTVTDDGRGFDYDALRHRALASGRWDEETVDGWDRVRLTSLIFEPGFTTRDQADEDAGHGVGMEVIKRQVRDGRGRIRLASRPGSYCRFVVTLPLPGVARAAA